MLVQLFTPISHDLYLLPINTAEMAETNVQTSKLLSLPGELRNRIYRIIAVHQQPIQITADHTNPKDDRINFWPKAPALSFTCKTMYDDIKTIFFEENTFQFAEQTLRENRLQMFRQQAGKSAGKLRKISIVRIFGIGWFGCTIRFTAKVLDDTVVLAGYAYDYINVPFSALEEVNGHEDEGTDVRPRRMCLCRIKEAAAASDGELLAFLEKYLEVDGVWKSRKPFLGLCNTCARHSITCAHHRSRNPGEQWNVWDTTAGQWRL